MRRILLPAICCCLLAACAAPGTQTPSAPATATPVLVTIDSVPPGASIWEGTELWGYAPVTLSYSPTGEFIQGGCMGTQAIRVEWDTGHAARINSISLCKSQGLEQKFLFLFPEANPYVEQTDAEKVANGDGGNGRSRVTSDGRYFSEVTAPGSTTSSDKPAPRCVSMVRGEKIHTMCN